MTSTSTWAAKITGFLTVAFLIVSCTFTTTRQKLPQFSIAIDSVAQRLDSVVRCQHFNINGAEKSTNGKVSSELEVDIINGVNIPTEDSSRKILGATIASRVKSELKPGQNYTTYKVLFVKKSTNNGVTSSEYTGFIFKSEDLSE